jgi:alpha-beta hydrolase superfamily lysophospholipase
MHRSAGVGTQIAFLYARIMKTSCEAVCLRPHGDKLIGVLFLPELNRPAPILIVCHGAGEFKENYFEMCEWLAAKGVATLAIDMYGHGESAGARFNVNMRQWVADVQAAIEFLLTHPKVDGKKIGAMGASSGGTAILETAIVDPRLKALVALDATVRNPPLPLPLTAFLKAFVLLGKIKKLCTGRDLCVNLAKLSGGVHLVSDPDVARRLQSDPRMVAPQLAFPFPGGIEAIFVDTINRVSKISIPTLVIWGEDDKLDSPETARLLFAALTCKKQIHIIPGNGHAGHLDRHKDKVFTLTADWALENLT